MVLVWQASNGILGLYISVPAGLYHSGASHLMNVGGEGSGKRCLPRKTVCSGLLGLTKSAHRAGKMGRGEESLPV